MVTCFFFFQYSPSHQSIQKNWKTNRQFAFVQGGKYSREERWIKSRREKKKKEEGENKKENLAPSFEEKAYTEREREGEVPVYKAKRGGV